MVFLKVGKAWLAHLSYSVVPLDSAAPTADAPAQSDAVQADVRLPPAGLTSELSNALSSARAAISNFLALIALEARRAGLALMWMVILAFIASICIVTAWMGVMAALAICAVAFGLSPTAAVIVIAMINLFAGAMLINACISISRDLLFTATRRQLSGECPVKPAAP
jgi:hypothetical protein